MSGVGKFCSSNYYSLFILYLLITLSSVECFVKCKGVY